MRRLILIKSSHGLSRRRVGKGAIFFLVTVQLIIISVIITLNFPWWQGIKTFSKYFKSNLLRIQLLNK